jgi:hypothetical protein
MHAAGRIGRRKQAEMQRPHGKLNKKNASRRIPHGDVHGGGPELPQVRKTDDAEDGETRCGRGIPVLGLRGVSGLPWESAAQIRKIAIGLEF